MSLESAERPPTPTDPRGRERTVLIIGAGPAGLAAARAMTARGLRYDHVEKHSGIGGLWDIERTDGPLYNSAHFNSSRTLSAYNDFPFDDELPDYPRHDQILDYLKAFADRHGLVDRIRFGVTVESIDKTSDGSWTATFDDLSAATYSAVVCSSGTQWTANMPEIPGDFTGEVRHAMTYRDSAELRSKRVLVVGAGASGCDLATDAAHHADRAAISMRRGYWFIPKHILGKPADVFGASGPHLPMWLQQKVFPLLLRFIEGDLTQLGLQKPDHKIFEVHPTVNSTVVHHLRHGDLAAYPAIANTSGRTVSFVDGTSAEFDLILCATGYRHTIAYAQKYFGNEQHPDLYLSTFSRAHHNLFGVGFVETNSSAFPLFDTMAQMVAGYLDDQVTRPAAAEEMAQMIRTDRPDLSGGIRFDSAPRHIGYVDSVPLHAYLTKVVEKMGWTATAQHPRSDVRNPMF